MQEGAHQNDAAPMNLEISLHYWREGKFMKYICNFMLKKYLRENFLRHNSDIVHLTKNNLQLHLNPI